LNKILHVGVSLNAYQARKILFKNSQPFWKNYQKTSEG